MLRTFAYLFPNSFHVSYLAVCREIFNPKIHTNCIGGKKDEVEIKFKERNEAKAKEQKTETENESLRRQVEELKQ